MHARIDLGALARHLLDLAVDHAHFIGLGGKALQQPRALQPQRGDLALVFHAVVQERLRIAAGRQRAGTRAVARQRLFRAGQFGLHARQFVRQEGQRAGGVLAALGGLSVDIGARDAVDQLGGKLAVRILPAHTHRAARLRRCAARTRKRLRAFALDLQAPAHSFGGAREVMPRQCKARAGRGLDPVHAQRDAVAAGGLADTALEQQHVLVEEAVGAVAVRLEQQGLVHQVFGHGHGVDHQAFAAPGIALACGPGAAHVAGRGEAVHQRAHQRRAQRPRGDIQAQPLYHRPDHGAALEQPRVEAGGALRLRHAAHAAVAALHLHQRMRAVLRRLGQRHQCADTGADNARGDDPAHMVHQGARLTRAGGLGFAPGGRTFRRCTGI
ncbi:hypothetical protein D3C72_1124600 [compost metagenome]